MSSDIVGIIGPGGEGGTFLDWTLHYLAGDSFMKYIHVDRFTHEVISVIHHHILKNPITIQGNAHKHKKAHPTEPIVQQCVDLYETIKDPRIKLLTMYIVASQESYDLGGSYLDFVHRIVNTTTGMKIIQFYHPDEMSDKLVQRIYSKIPDNTENFADIESSVRASCSETGKIINNPNVYSLNIETMFSDLDTEIHKIFAWLNLPIDESRYTAWLPVYREWQNA